MTKQQAWQKKQKKKGRCIVCGKKAVNKNHCRVHRNYYAAYTLARYHASKT